MSLIMQHYVTCSIVSRFGKFYKILQFFLNNCSEFGRNPTLRINMSAGKRQRTNPEEQSGGKRSSKGSGKGGGKGASIKVEPQEEMSSATRAEAMGWIKRNKPWHQ